MQDLADFAAIRVVVRWRRYSAVVFDDRGRKAAGEIQLVMVPANKDRLEEDREQTKSCAEQTPSGSPLRHARRHSLHRPLSTRWWP